MGILRAMLKLKVETRDLSVNPNDLRAEGVLPAVCYGPKEAPVAISLDMATFEKTWKEAGETTIVTLEGVGEAKEVLIHQVDTHPVKGTVQHVDFYAIERGKLLEVSVPVEFEGEAPAEKVGGVVVKVLHEIDIKVRPSELPQHFTVDLSKLENIGDQILVGDIKIPASAELQIDADEVVVSITEAKEDTAEAEEAAAADAASEAAAAEGEETSTE